MKVLSTAAIAAVMATLAPCASAYELKHTEAGGVVGWRSQAVTWSIDASVDEVPGARDAVLAAIAEWSGQRGAPKMAVTSANASLAPAQDGVNSITFAKGGYAPAGKALAVTIVHYDSTTGAIVDADIVLNGRYKLASLADERGREVDGEGNGKEDAVVDEHDASTDKTYDVGRIAAHEMGHALGLADEPGNAAALMYPFVAPDRALDAEPTRDDLDGVAVIYEDVAAERAAAPKGAACNAAPGTPGGGSVAAASLGAIAIMAARRRRRG